MSALTQAIALPSGSRRWLRMAAAVLTAGMAAVGLGVLLGRGQIHLAIALGALALLGGLVVLGPRRAIPGLIVWLVALALIRRLANYATGSIPGQDPLLLVAPAVVALLALVAFKNGALRDRTPLTWAAIALAGLALLGAFNPLQGGLRVGLGGLLFTLVPMLWFPVGRTLADDRVMRRVWRLVGALALVAAGYGIYQVVGGFPTWDQRWIEQGGYTALNVRGTIRPFSSFASGAGYAVFLAVGLIAYWLVRSHRATGRLVALLAAAVLIAAVVLQGSRGIVVTGLVTVGIVWAARRNVATGWALVSGLAAVTVLFTALNTWGPQVQPDSGVGSLVSHQVAGLSNPLDPASSTARLHGTMLVNGVTAAFENPVGKGTGTITIAASTFGGRSAGAEMDPSRTGLAWGLPGLAAYVMLAVTAAPRAYRLARQRRDVVALGGLGVLTVTFLQWLNGGQYAVAALVWLTLGWLDRPQNPPPDESPAT